MWVKSRMARLFYILMRFLNPHLFTLIAPEHSAELNLPRKASSSRATCDGKCRARPRTRPLRLTECCPKPLIASRQPTECRPRPPIASRQLTECRPRSLIASRQLTKCCPRPPLVSLQSTKCRPRALTACRRMTECRQRSLTVSRRSPSINLAQQIPSQRFKKEVLKQIGHFDTVACCSMTGHRCLTKRRWLSLSKPPQDISASFALGYIIKKKEFL